MTHLRSVPRRQTRADTLPRPHRNTDAQAHTSIKFMTAGRHPQSNMACTWPSFPAAMFDSVQHASLRICAQTHHPSGVPHGVRRHAPPPPAPRTVAFGFDSSGMSAGSVPARTTASVCASSPVAQFPSVRSAGVIISRASLLSSATSRAMMPGASTTTCQPRPVAIGCKRVRHRRRGLPRTRTAAAARARAWMWSFAPSERYESPHAQSVTSCARVRAQRECVNVLFVVEVLVGGGTCVCVWGGGAPAATHFRVCAVQVRREGSHKAAHDLELGLRLAAAQVRRHPDRVPQKRQVVAAIDQLQRPARVGGARAHTPALTQATHLNQRRRDPRGQDQVAKLDAVAREVPQRPARLPLNLRTPVLTLPHPRATAARSRHGAHPG